MATVLVSVRMTLSQGPPGVGTAATRLQKPPLSVNWPPLSEPASGWPMVPVTTKTLPVLGRRLP